MFSKLLLSFHLLFVVFSSNATSVPLGCKADFNVDQQKWGFANVREGTHLFWWLYYTTANVSKPSDRPLAIWLQGGPGASSTGYGNFEEIGPLDLFLNKRNYTWVKDMNVLFIDSPVGSGFSYVDDKKYLTTSNLQIGSDLVQLVRIFLDENPDFKSVPLHIFSESYGGKVSVEFAYLLNHEIQNRQIDCNLKSVTSVDGWISPIDSMLSWAPFLLHLGLVDQDGYDAIQQSTALTQRALENGEFSHATNLWRLTQVVTGKKTSGVDWYNVMRPQISRKYGLKKKIISESAQNDIDFGGRSSSDIALTQYDEVNRDNVLEKLMRETVSQSLKIPSHIKWGAQSSATFRTLSGDFMKPAIHIVEKLLNETSIEVNIITGQLDLIVATPGTVDWIQKVRWPGASGFADSERKVIGVNHVLEGYYKRHNQLSLYWINRAGHMVPADNPGAMDWILQRVTKYKQY